jgi:hypothetical protein
LESLDGGVDINKALEATEAMVSWRLFRTVRSKETKQIVVIIISEPNKWG